MSLALMTVDLWIFL